MTNFCKAPVRVAHRRQWKLGIIAVLQQKHPFIWLPSRIHYYVAVSLAALQALCGYLPWIGLSSTGVYPHRMQALEMDHSYHKYQNFRFIEAPTVPDSLLRICAQYLIPRQWLSHCILYSCFLSSVLKTRWPHLRGGRVTVCWLCACSSSKEMPLWNKGRALTWCRSRCRKTVSNKHLRAQETLMNSGWRLLL